MGEGGRDLKRTLLCTPNNININIRLSSPNLLRNKNECINNLRSVLLPFILFPMSSLPGPEKPFQIAISEDKLAVLQKKLELTTFPDELEDAGTKYGAPLKDIKRLVEHWKSNFNWAAQQAALNKEFPQFTRDISVANFGTLNIHYVHQKSSVEGAIPLLFVHGWPGSFIEARKIMPLLVEASPDHPSFHFVTFSLPGYGFSDAPTKQGFAIAQYAEVGHQLMLSLGYEQYVVQGGDWGSRIAFTIAKAYGHKHAKAFHTNMPIGRAPTLTKEPFLYLRHLVTPYSAFDRREIVRFREFEKTGYGYFFAHATKPQTIGYSLADSPVGLLAWIYEKLVSWTDSYPWTDDEVLTWISIYFLSKAGPAASVRIYYEFMRTLSQNDGRPTIPYGISYFPKEIAARPKIFQRTNANVVFEVEHDKGGHFAATEEPEVLVGDLRKMFGKGGPAFGVVDGKPGY